jgi:hypothetical protein
VHLHPRALQRAVEQAAEQERLLVGDVLGKRDPEPGALALDPCADRGDGVGPGRADAADHWGLQAGRVVDVGVLEAAAIADPALIDVVVLVRRNPDELATALPLRDAAADRASRADGRGLRHVPRARFEPPYAGGEGAHGAKVDDVAAEDRLQGLVELAGDERLHAALVGGQLLLPRDLVVVASAPVAEHAALAVQGDLLGEWYRLLEVEARPVDAAVG